MTNPTCAPALASDMPPPAGVVTPRAALGANSAPRHTVERPARWARLLVALLVAAAAVAFFHTRPAAFPSDLDVQWMGARAFWSGQDAYALTGPGRPLDWPAPLAYPAPTLAALAPLAALPLAWARVVFVALTAGACAYAVTRRAWAPVLVVASWPFAFATFSAQWSPLLAAAALTPALAWVAACKPTVGLVTAAYATDRRWWQVAVAGGVTLAVVAWVVQPDWLPAWRGALDGPTAPYIGTTTTRGVYEAPVARPGGWLALLALLRWRRPEARALVALACVPQTLMGYELVLLLALVPATWLEGALLVACSWMVRWQVIHTPGPETLAEVQAVAGSLSVWWLFLPAALLVLARPNVGPPAAATP